MTFENLAFEVAPATARYFELVRLFPLRLIRTEAQLDRAMEILDELGGDDDPGVHDYRLALAALVEHYESEHHPIPTASPAAVLRHLMDVRGQTQSEVSASSGVPMSTLSEVHSGKRAMSRGVMTKLAGHFHVDPGVFL